MPETDEFWDFYWDTRLSSIETLGKRAAILAASRAIRRLAGQVGRPLRLLELGCGEGQIIGTLLDAHTSICDVRASTGVDYNPRSLARCRQATPGAHWVEGDFTDAALLAGLGSFDLVLLVNALHEVFSATFSAELGEVDVEAGKRRVAQALSLAAGCLDPSGCLILFDGLEPPGDPRQPVRVRFLSRTARTEFEQFAREYHPFRVSFRDLDRTGLVELSQHDFVRYIDKSIFLGKELWASERLESYQYFTEAEFRAAFSASGLEITELEMLTVNGDKWRSRVELDPPEAGFPVEHILISAQRRCVV
jgi:SAM-dependent methyltransferase